MAPIPKTAAPPARAAKAKNLRIEMRHLAERARWAQFMGFAKPRWVEFCEIALRRGFDVYLYEAKHTASKYITLFRDGRSFKVRFSNHKPIARRELAGDCDFFVGVTNLTITTTGDALRAAARHFGDS